MINMKPIQVVFLVLVLTGCASVKETAKTIWGSSTRALEDARVDAISRSFYCDIDECFDAVLTLNLLNKKSEPATEKYFNVFIEDRIKSHIIVYGIPGNVDTTEVAVFFARDGADAIRIDVASLSSSAKQKTADAVFKELSARFNVKYAAAG